MYVIPKSPVGMVLTAAAVVFAISPEARKFTRRMAVKGLAGVLSAVDQLKASSSAAQGQWKQLLSEAKQADSEQQLCDHSPSFYDSEIEPVPFAVEMKNPSPAVNLLNDDYLKKQYAEFEKHP
jgi:hypothetical protein